MAQSAVPAHAASEATALSSCVAVTVNGQPALSYTCLNQHLAASTHPASGPSIPLDAVAHAPSNQQVGQFNFAAFSHQMGNSLGKSVTPQRPPPPPPLPLFGAPVATH